VQSCYWLTLNLFIFIKFNTVSAFVNPPHTSVSQVRSSTHLIHQYDRISSAFVNPPHTSVSQYCFSAFALTAPQCLYTSVRQHFVRIDPIKLLYTPRTSLYRLSAFRLAGFSVEPARGSRFRNSPNRLLSLSTFRL
jgi:hypothetical protein